MLEVKSTFLLRLTLVTSDSRVFPTTRLEAVLEAGVVVAAGAVLVEVVVLLPMVVITPPLELLLTREVVGGSFEVETEKKMKKKISKKRSSLSKEISPNHVSLQF